MHLNLLRCWLT